MEVINEALAPITFIDAIPFERVASIRSALQERGFQQKYDAIVSDFLSRIAAGNTIDTIEKWDTSYTIKLIEELASEFRRYFESEVVNYKTATQKAHEEQAIWAFAETAKHGLHFAPGIRELIAGIEMVKSYAEGIKHTRAVVLLRDRPQPNTSNTNAANKRRNS
jgi:hypothetical protein